MFYRKTKKIKPIVLITLSDTQSHITRLCMKLSVRFAGGLPICITPSDKQYPKAFDALILAGGTDIVPERYGKEKKKNYNYDLQRDVMELDYLEQANQKQCPVLGVCRGAQLMNVYHGGSLHLDITKAFEKAAYPSNIIGYIFFRKTIYITPRSLLRKIINKPSIRVNSLHRQSVDSIGRGLTATSFEDNGIVQSIEDKEKPFYLGVQFHPEYLIHKKSIRGIFTRLIQAATSTTAHPGE